LKGVTVAGITGNANPEVAARAEIGDYKLFLFIPEVLLNQSEWRHLFNTDEYASRVKRRPQEGQAYQ